MQSQEVIDKINRIKGMLLRSSDSDLIDKVVEQHGSDLKVCTGVISMETCEWIAVFVVGNKAVLKVGVQPV